MKLLDRFRNSKPMKNLWWIFTSSVIHAVFAFLISVLAAREFSETDYGILNYAYSITTLFSSFCGLGLNIILIKEIADDKEHAGEILASGILLRCIASVVSVLLICIYSIIRENTDLSGTIIKIYSITIVISSFDLLIFWFRYEYKSDHIAIIKLTALAVSAAIKVTAIYQNRIVLFAIGAISETICFVGFLLFKYIRERGMDLKPSLRIGKKLLRMSVPFVLSAILVTIYAQTDTIMLEAIISYDAVAYYSVSLRIANVIGVALSSLLEAFRPEIAKARNEDQQRYHLLYMRLYGLTFWISVLYGLIVTLFSRQILGLLYGDKYLCAQNTLIMISWYSAFAHFGAIHSIYMVSEDKSKWVQVLTLSGVITNVIVNCIFIPVMGATGAALATLLTQFVSNFVMLFVIRPLRPIIKLAVKGILSIKDIILFIISRKEAT